MNLADRIVALGVGIHDPSLGGGNYWIPDRIWPPILAEQFTHSWEVAGALMEKCGSCVIIVDLENAYPYIEIKPQQSATVYEPLIDSLPLAINLACAKALEA